MLDIRCKNLRSLSHSLSHSPFLVTCTHARAHTHARTHTHTYARIHLYTHASTQRHTEGSTSNVNVQVSTRTVRKLMVSFWVFTQLV